METRKTKRRTSTSYVFYCYCFFNHDIPVFSGGHLKMKIKNWMIMIASVIVFTAANLVFYFAYFKNTMTTDFFLLTLSFLLYALAFGVDLFTIFKRPLIPILGGIAFGLLLFGFWGLYEGALYRARWELVVTNIVVSVVLFFAVLIVAGKISGQPRIWQSVIAVSIMLALAVIPNATAIASGYCQTYTYRVPVPTEFASYTPKQTALVDDADLYVSTDGNDENDGSFTHPLKTIEKARDLVRAMDKTGRSGITVAVKAGDYRVSSAIEFTADDSGTKDCPITYCAYGDGEVSFNGGVVISSDHFSHVTDQNQLSRLTKDAQKNVRHQPVPR